MSVGREGAPPIPRVPELVISTLASVLLGGTLVRTHCTSRYLGTAPGRSASAWYLGAVPGHVSQRGTLSDRKAKVAPGPSSIAPVKLFGNMLTNGRHPRLQSGPVLAQPMCPPTYSDAAALSRRGSAVQTARSEKTCVFSCSREDLPFTSPGLRTTSIAGQLGICRRTPPSAPD